jgi:hypothetical protein
MIRFWVSSSALLMAATLSAPSFLTAQSSGAATKTDAKTAAKTGTTAANTKGWVTPRTPDGQPDLQGYWTAISYTPFERPAKYGNREFLTDQETQDVFNAGVQNSFDGGANTKNDAIDDPNSADYDFKTYGLSPWQQGVKPNNRTSMVVDPPDGRIPPLTTAAKERLRNYLPEGGCTSETVAGQPYNCTVHADVPIDVGVATSCLAEQGGPPIKSGGYNNGLHIVQSHGFVLIETEYGTENRIIPLDGSPHPSAKIRQWHGDGRGHWEGDTLVVETTNFRPENTYRNSQADTLRITEYFTRTAQDKIEYKFTVDDPSTWTKPWTAITPLTPIQGPLWEYACSESNMDLIQIMVGARNAEKAAGEKAKGAVPVSQK